MSGVWCLVSAPVQVTTVWGADRVPKHAKRVSAAAEKFHYTYGICFDPLRPMNVYVGDMTAIRYLNTETDTVDLIAGSSEPGMANGIGPAAQFYIVFDIVCMSAGNRLLATDYNNGVIRAVDPHTRAVTTIAGDGGFDMRDGIGLKCSIFRPRKLTFDRSRSVKPESALYITCDSAIRRFDLATAEMITCEWDGTIGIDPWSIAATPGGQVLVGCFKTNSIHLFDPQTNSHKLLTGTYATAAGQSGFGDVPGLTVQFNRPYALCVADDARCLYISDSGNCRIRCTTLPDSLFS